MIWNKVQLWAKANKCLVYAIDQGSTPALKQPGPWGAIDKGYCAGLAIRWIFLRYRDDDYDYDKSTKECDMPDWRATRDQTQFQIGKGSVDAGLATALGPYDLTVDDKRKVAGHEPLTATALTAAASKTGCYFVTIRGKDSEGEAIGHAVAVERLESHYSLFDANFGHFFAEGAAAFAFIVGHYLQMTEYGAQYAEAFGIYPVKSPEADMGIELRPERPA